MIRPSDIPTHHIFAAMAVTLMGGLTACLLGVGWLWKHADDALVVDIEAGELL